MYCEKEQSHPCNSALFLLFPVCRRSVLEEVPVRNTSPLSFPSLKWFVYYGIIDRLCAKNLLLKRSCHFCSLHIKKGYLSIESPIYGALWEQCFPACVSCFHCFLSRVLCWLRGKKVHKQRWITDCVIYKYKHLFFLVWMLSFPLKLCRLPKISSFSKLLTFSLLLPDSVENTSCCYQFHILRASSDFEYRLCFWEGQK